MKSILKYILITAMRDWLYLAIFITLIIAFGISSLIGSTAFIENNQFSITYIAGSSRIIFAVGIILFICFNIRKSFDNKEIEFILSKSISRNIYISSYILGFFTVAILALIPVILLLMLMPNINYYGLFFWSISIIFEALIFISFSTLASFIFGSALFAVIASFCFYIISRMMGFVVMAISLPQEISNITNWKNILESLMKIISIPFPRLDLFAKSEWLIYGTNIDLSEIFLIIGQSLIYVFLMIFMCFHDFNKKEF